MGRTFERGALVDRDSLTQLRSIVASAADAIVVVDHTGQIVGWNPAATDTFGHSEGEALGRSLEMLMPERFRSGHRGGIDRRAQGGEAKLQGGVVELVGLRKDGREFPIELTLSGWETDGELWFSAIIRDISARKAAEWDLHQERERFSSLAAHAPVGILETDPSGACTYANDLWCDFAGRSAEEMVGVSWLSLVHPSDREGARGAWTEFLAGDVPEFAGDYRLVRSAASTVWIDVRVVPLRSPEGDVLGYIGTATDITERRELERTKDELISVVSHEVRTPLTSVRGALTMLSDDDGSMETEARTRMLEIALRNSERLGLLVNDILDLQRLASGTGALEPTLTDAATIAGDALESMGALAAEKNIQLVLAAEDLPVRADAQRIVQVLNNFLSNAVKFSPEGGIVQVGARQEGDDVQFCVRDQGVGIPADMLETIFGRFQQVDSSDVRRVGGTGLGLAISREIAQQHGGRVWAESEVGRGSCFWLSLPAGGGPAPAD